MEMSMSFKNHNHEMEGLTGHWGGERLAFEVGEAVGVEEKV